MKETIGVDVSKDILDAFRTISGEYRQFKNTKVGLKGFIQWVREDGPVSVVFEASGAYHRGLEAMLTSEGLAFSKVNPMQARRFAQAIGQVAKTDKVDAQVLAKMGAVLDLRPSQVQSQSILDLKELMLSRRALVKDRTVVLTRLKTVMLQLVKKHMKQRLAQIERQLAQVDMAIKTLINEVPDLRARFDILVSIPGISNISASALLTDMPELGHMTGKQAAALAGLAPMSRQSGRWQGHERIQGGRASLRRALFMPALSAIQHNKTAKVKFEKLVQNGKPRKVALIAVMRKLIVLANALLRDARKWSETGP